jgi:hypothetical protein
MSKNKLRVVGAIASLTGITLYLEDGNTHELPTDTVRTKMIMEQIMPFIAKRQVAVLDVDTFSAEALVEKKTGGLIRFMQMAKSKVKSALGFTDSEMQTYFPEKPDTSFLDNAKPVETRAPKEETIPVAVVAGKIIPGIEALEKQIDYAAYSDNTIGLQRFLERIAAVIDNRGHSTMELLNFMKKGDLPIADDGSIVAYKVLQSKDDRFVDCHSGRVMQKVGSLVCMAESLVDMDRRTQCSTGLHIARRGYLSGFSGDVMTIVKVAPEAVIAVPSGEPNKMRAAAYHVVAEIPKDLHTLLRSNKPMTSVPAAATLLANVIRGNHVGITEKVEISGPMGDGVTIVSMDGASDVPKIEAIAPMKALDDVSAVSPKEVRAIAEKIVAEEPITLAHAIVAPDMSAALNTPEPAKPKKQKVEKPAPVDPAPKVKIDTDKAVPATPELISKIIQDTVDARDAKVLKLIAEGKTQQQAADISGVNYRTVRRIVARSKG